MKISATLTTPSGEIAHVLQAQVQQRMFAPGNTATIWLSLGHSSHSAHQASLLKSMLPKGNKFTLKLTAHLPNQTQNYSFEGIVHLLSFYDQYAVLEGHSPLKEHLLSHLLSQNYHETTLAQVLTELLPANTQQHQIPAVSLHNYLVNNQTAWQVVGQLQRMFGVVVYQNPDATATVATTPHGLPAPAVVEVAYAHNILTDNTMAPAEEPVFQLQPSSLQTNAVLTTQPIQANGLPAVGHPLPVANLSSTAAQQIKSNLMAAWYCQQAQGRVSATVPPFAQVGQVAQLKPNPSSGKPAGSYIITQTKIECNPQIGLQQTLKLGQPYGYTK